LTIILKNQSIASRVEAENDII